MLNCNLQKEEMIKVISEGFVKPKHEIEAAKEPHYLGPHELLMLHIEPIQKGLLYTLSNPSSSTLSNLLDKLRSALSVALVHFYPLAGRFRTQKYPDEGACTVFLDCNKGPGARLIHATAHRVSVRDILSPTYSQEIVHSLFDLGEKFVNYDCHTRPVLSIQVTELADGVFIGFTMSHSVVDGTSFLHFISILSEIFCLDANEDTLQISRLPVVSHKFWSEEPNISADGPVIKIPHPDIEEIIKRNVLGPLKEQIFHFTSSSMARLKAKANQESATHNISSFQALTALVWRSITKARCLSPDQETACALLVNARSRLDPPVGDSYFGNYLSQARVNCKVEDLLSNDLGCAAMHINKCIAEHDNASVYGFLKSLKDLLICETETVSKDEIHGPNNVVIGGSARFDMYKPEFGLGKAVAVRMGFANKEDGKVTANPGCEGGGSVDLEILLSPENMAALEADQEFMSFVSLG